MSVAIVSYGATTLLRRCLQAVSQPTREVIVVNNGPRNEGDQVRRDFPDVELIEPPGNLGFGGGANLAVSRARAPWILLLNPDARPETGGAIERLIEFAERDPGLGAVGPLLFSSDGRPQRSAIAAPLGAIRLALWAALPEAASAAYSIVRRGSKQVRTRGLRRSEFLMAAALLLRREAFEQIGGFDTRFFLYGEDADLCFRLRKTGWRVEVCPDARFVHLGGGSTASDAVGAYQELLRSWLRLIAKYKGERAAERARRLLVPVMRLRARVGRVERRRAALAWLRSDGAAGPRNLVA